MSYYTNYKDFADIPPPETPNNNLNWFADVCCRVSDLEKERNLAHVCSRVSELQKERNLSCRVSELDKEKFVEYYASPAMKKIKLYDDKFEGSKVESAHKFGEIMSKKQKNSQCSNNQEKDKKEIIVPRLKLFINCNDSIPTRKQIKLELKSPDYVNEPSSYMKKRKLFGNKFEERKEELVQKEMKLEQKLKRIVEGEVVEILPPATREAFLKKITEVSAGAITSWEQMKMVMKKNLFQSDLKRSLNRLLIPLKAIECKEFLEQEGKVRPGGRNESKNCNTIQVNILEPSLHVSGLNLCMWRMTENMYYALNGSRKTNNSCSWNDIVKKNGLGTGMCVELWAFRVQQRLWFALLRRPQLDKMVK